MSLSQAQQLASELQSVLASIRKVLEGVDWSEKPDPKRKPAVVIGHSIGKLVAGERLASAIANRIAEHDRADTERARLTHACVHCDDTHVVRVLVGAEERVIPCRVCGPFSHTGAAA